LCFNLLRFTFCGSKFGTIKSKLNWVFYLTFFSFLHLLKIIYYYWLYHFSIVYISIV
jgi:hypothetical protein